MDSAAAAPILARMNLQNAIFDGWAGPLRVIVVGTLAYGLLILALRASGKRTLSKLNAFDLVITVSFGSTLATILLSRDTPLAEGATALVLLIALQYAVARLSVASGRFARLVRAEPTLLLSRGSYCRDAMRRERITEADIEQVIRKEGLDGAGAVRAVILESDGSFAVFAADRPAAGGSSDPI